MMPINIIDVLTAATPIVASVANIVTSNKKSDNAQEINTTKQPNNTININITNHFYTNCEQDSYKVAKTVEEQVKNSVIESGIRYLL